METIRYQLRKVLMPSISSGSTEEGIKNLLTSLASLMSLGGVVWGSLLVYFGLYNASIIPYGYVLISFLNVALVLPHRVGLARFIQITASMLLPFGLQWMLGGFFSSGIVMLWSTLSLVGSVILLKGKSVYPWLSFFIVLTLFSVWIEPYVGQFKPPILTLRVSEFLLTVNLLMISTIVFILSKNKTDHDLEINRQLESANSELEKHKSNLERLVKERTEQLEANIMLLTKVQADMKRAKEEAEKANDAKSQFLANMSHEIRSPLNAILGFSQIMTFRSNKSALSPEFRQYLDNIKLSGENLLELINNILDLSKIEAGKAHLAFETLNLKQLFKGIYQINKGKAEEKSLRFTYEIDQRLPDFLEGDRTKLNQVLMNLVSNAIKFSPAGKSVHMKLGAERGEVILQVSDTGVGIAANRLPYIFDPFEQADNSITRKFGGTGLGLTITHKMVHLLNGSIEVGSVENAGTTFTVRLPLLPSMGATDTSESPSLLSAKFHNAITALVVEDNDINQQLLNILFKELEVKVVQAFNGQEGIDKFVLDPPDIVIMDIHMPIMDGLEAIRRIRAMEQYNDIPIICLTADAFTDQQEKAMSLGANEYLTKPIAMDKLVHVLTKFFGPEALTANAK